MINFGAACLEVVGKQAAATLLRAATRHDAWGIVLTAAPVVANDDEFCCVLPVRVLTS